MNIELGLLIVSVLFFVSIVADWTVMLCDVLLFSSAINCLFQMLAYGKAFDIIIFILSLGLGIFVYFKALNSKKNPAVTVFPNAVVA